MTLLDDYLPLLGDEAPSKACPPYPVSEEEFVAWCDDDTRAEWKNGEVQLMSPVNLRHGEVNTFLLNLVGTFASYCRSGKVFTEPVHVRLHPALRRSPDIIYIANQNSQILKEQVVDGAPDLLMEVVSPGSSSRDYRIKFAEYQSAGVCEYWIIDPGNSVVEAHRLENNLYVLIKPTEGQLRSCVLPGFYIRPEWLRAHPMPEVYPCLQEIIAAHTQKH
jgi:Uma2 family endonuclease